MTYVHTYRMEVVRRLVDHCPIKFSREFPIFQTRVLPCIIIMKQEFYQIPVRLRSFENLRYFFSNSCSGGRIDFLSTPHLIHNNHLFTVPDDGNFHNVRGHRISEFFLHAILRMVEFQGLPFCHWCKNSVHSFYLLLTVWGK